MVDRIFGWLMIVSALLHSYGCLVLYRHQPELLLWSLTAGLAELYLGAANLVRAERRHDLVLARLCVFGNISWLVVVFFYAALVGRVLDVRVLIQFTVAAALLVLSLRARNRSRPM